MIPNRKLNRKEFRQTLLALFMITLIALLGGCGRDRDEEAADTQSTPVTVASDNNEQLASAVSTATNSPTSTSTPVPTPSPTSTPTVNQRLKIGQQDHRHGDYAAARNEFSTLLAASDADPAAHQRARLDLGRAYLADGFYTEGLNEFDALLAELAVAATIADSDLRAKAHFLRGDTLTALGRYDEAATAYALSLEGSPLMTEFTQQRIGQAALAQGGFDKATLAYRRAADALILDMDVEDEPQARISDVVSYVGLLELLADLYLRAGRYADAVNVYDEILTVARIAAYRADIQQRAGQALATAGDEAGAVERWLAATAEDPTSAPAYAALVELVNREVEVDPYQRAYIDLQAEAWYPAIAAYEAFLDASAPDDPLAGRAMLGLGAAQTGAGEYADALATLDRLTAAYPDCDCFGEAWLAKAYALTAQGDRASAKRLYRTFARDYPDDPLAPEALWQSGLMAFADNNQPEAALDFLALADGFPESERAPQALYVIGVGALQAELPTTAVSALARIQQNYPDHRPAAVSYWLGRAQHEAGDAETGNQVWRAAVSETPDMYYGILSAQSLQQPRIGTNVLINRMDVIAGPPSTLDGDDGSQAFAVGWLDEWADVDGADAVVEEIATDPDLAATSFLLDVDARGEAIAVADRVYARHKDDPRALYALSLRAEELGLYRLSMISIARLLATSPARLIEDAPIFMQQRLYPRPFDELITREAEANGLDPLLFFSLIRQESQFEEGARSHAAAQGLAQIIPDTGAWVAERLGHVEYHNGLIYRPTINLQYGAYYLGWARDYLDGNLISALVGYNAGPGNAERWRELYGYDDPWYVERMDFNEPRVYVQTVLQNLYHYSRLYE